MTENEQFTPEEFVIWLHGYASAKPEVLDERTRSALQGVIAFLVGKKLRGATEKRSKLDEMIYNQRKLGVPMPPSQPWPTYVGSPTWVSTDGTGQPPQDPQTVISSAKAVPA
jgi:hypothetical protein